MPKSTPAAGEAMPGIQSTRRRFLGGIAIASLPVAAAAAPEPVQQSAPTIDDFLAKALPSERIRYHSNALVEAMAEMHPERVGWRVHTDHEHDFVLVVPNRKPGVHFQHTGRDV